MKKIALTPRLVYEECTHEIREALDIRWGKLLCKLGFLPVVVPTSITDFDDYIDRLGLGGIILSGGNSLSCVSDDTLSIRRDAFERFVLEAASAKEIPVLGVCRGAQFIADYFGGSVERIDGHVGTMHFVEVANSRFGLQSGMQNSFHDFAIIDAGELTPCAFSEDGAIEAVEHPRYKILGIMWHPERGMGINDLNLVKNFFGD